MPDLRQFKLPDVGEGLTEGEILSWLVAVGDTVTVNQPLCEVETAKAAVELPSPFAGTVTELLYEPGTTVDVGAPIITIDLGGDGPAAPAAPAAAEPAGSGLIGETGANGRTAVLVGYGPRSTEATRRPRRNGAGAAARATAPQVLPEADYGSGGERPPLLATAPDATVKPVRHGGLETGRAAEAHVTAADTQPAPTSSPVSGRGALRPLAKPPVRKYAKDLGVDLATVTGSGPGGVITRADVDAALATPAPAGFGAETPAGFGAETGRGDQRIPIKGVRKHTAAAMVASAFTAPHVTEFLTVDVTRVMKLRERLAARPEFAGVKVSPLLFVAKALLLAAQRHPMVNSSWDDAAQEIVVHGAVNLGIAAATPRGLVVPNIKDAGRLSLVELAGALTELTATARAGRTSPADMSGGTITITNVGVFGVDTGTPILNPGESAILAFGAVREMPWVHKGRIRVRQVTQLALSFDHRIIDGELGSRFLADVGALLHDPGTALAF
ncbi:Dihydrolipoyllysine-residue acetyltransferase component of pyruvate dehydrogenase complex [Modestobacter italicus]|uniref:Dihydrolipoamide acetyltransferase component of pyruvate dehydrogenase complex n=1 Tax=Modestobacter italicus (strain DSM 44449 / CECT 9708 / BC 501) TaxID=2732864 RepID=I4F4Q0_MODI5|nr:dihydrolipoamide acetyltransferase family protein [Modestobacter marinus]CCH90613.1 Dihydrolipoyllysine-residue acetyltransferase component of pyruvate dehydrogenase complex [Modestobacter marinus]